LPEYTIHWRDSLPSTNSALREWWRDYPELSEGTVLAARCQTAGRGRLDRTWITAPGRDLAFSLLLRPCVPPGHLPSLPMAAALAVAHALDAFGLAAQVKWPNDVLVGGRKICGILSEALALDPAPVIILGIGVNVNMTEMEAAAIDRPATSLYIETGKPQTIEAVLDAVLEALPPCYVRWEDQGFSGLREDWLVRVRGLGEAVSINTGEETRDGILEGFGERGDLLLRDARGAIVPLIVGDLDVF
jgi:BirA family transcriptional regulator, biotin operon repressor / biotin---[acetyl-CoA-carboxylase] ligase